MIYTAPVNQNSAVLSDLIARNPLQGRRLVWLLGIGLLALTYWAYHETLSFGFVNFDDPQYVTANARVHAGLSSENLKWALTTSYFSNWHPVVWLSYMLDYELFGLDPGAFHAVNLGFHLANSLLLFLILRKATGETLASFVVAGFFAVHPLHCESVTWVSERKDVLSTFFGILAIAAYNGYVRRPNRHRYLAVTVFLALGLMTKSMLVTWPFIFFLWDVWPARRIAFPPSLRTVLKLLLEKLPWFGLAVAVSAISLLVQGQSSLEALPFHLRLANALVSYGRYIGKTFAPFNLAVFYPHPRGNIDIGEILAAALILACVTALAVLTLRSRPYIAVGWFWYLGTLVPVIGLVQIGYQGMADRYMYVPSIGLFISIVWVAKELSRRFGPTASMTAGFALAVALLVLAWSTVRQNIHWRDSVSLFRHAIEVTGDNAFAHNNLGAALGETGDLQSAQLHFVRALEIDPGYPQALYNQGRILFRTGRRTDAIAFFQRAVQESALDAEYRCSLAEALLSIGRTEEALQHYGMALQIEPDHRGARFGRASCYLIQDQIDKAVAEYERVLELDPKNVAALVNLGSARAIQRRFSEAARFLETALRLDPKNVDCLKNRGRLFEDLRQFDQAAANYREALRLDPKSVSLREALERVGHFREPR